MDDKECLRNRCILSKFYIKPQPARFSRVERGVVSYRNSTSNHNTAFGTVFNGVLYLIEILHQTTTPFTLTGFNSGCILSKFYIKPQQRVRHPFRRHGCILSKFYIKPQRLCRHPSWSSRCILSKFYIKPQLSRMYSNLVKVVSYRNSTSNHNDPSRLISSAFVVSYRNSTSNHNRSGVSDECPPVVSYRNSTSNHNNLSPFSKSEGLYLIEILHQTTTLGLTRFLPNGCILSKFYIKPQQ